MAVEGTYTGDPASSRKDAVRALIGDTGGEDNITWILSDAEIAWFDSMVTPSYDDAFMTAAVCADIISGRYAAEVSISTDGDSIATEQLQDKYKALAATLRTTYQTIAGAGGYPLVGGIDRFRVIDPTMRPLLFAIGQNDNVRAGNQDVRSADGSEENDGYPHWLESGPW
jgi:hypothetical protein